MALYGRYRTKYLFIRLKAEILCGRQKFSLPAITFQLTDASLDFFVRASFRKSFIAVDLKIKKLIRGLSNTVAVDKH